MTAELKKGAAVGDPELSLRLERVCINFDKLSFVQTPQEINRNEKQLTQSWAAQKALLFLKTNPEGYRQEINALSPGGLKNLPEGDAYITHVQAQIKNLGQIRYAMPTTIQKELVSARQENLKAGEKGYKTLQKNALFPPSGQNQKQGGNMPPGDGISAVKADEIQRDEKLLSNSENESGSSPNVFFDSKKQGRNSQKPAMSGKKEWRAKRPFLIMKTYFGCAI